MEKINNKKLKVMIVEDEDILLHYKDFLSTKGMRRLQHPHWLGHG
jgi:hypothetical protein